MSTVVAAVNPQFGAVSQSKEFLASAPVSLFYTLSGPRSAEHEAALAKAIRQIETEWHVKFTLVPDAKARPHVLIFDFSSSDFPEPHGTHIEISHTHDDLRTAFDSKICFDMRWFRGYHSQDLYLFSIYELRHFLVAALPIVFRTVDVCRVSRRDVDWTCDSKKGLPGESCHSAGSIAGSCISYSQDRPN